MQIETSKPKNKSRLETKVLIGLASLAGTFGLWSFFAAKAADEVKPAPQPVNNGARQSIVFPPMPTLAAIRTLDPAAMGVNAPANTTSSALRQVSQPTPVPQVVQKPVFEQLTINRPGSGSGGTSARSGSSR
jgi:hypothetical protein